MEENQTPLTYEELQARYGNPRKRSRQTQNAFIVSLVALIGAAVLAVCMFASFVQPVTILGSHAERGEPIGLLPFLSARIHSVEARTDNILEGDVESILGFSAILRDFVAAFCAAECGIATIVCLLLAIVRFMQKKPTVPHALVAMLAWDFVPYVLFPFLCNASGGSGALRYTLGFLPAIGSYVGMALGLCAFIACIILVRIDRRATLRAERFRRLASAVRAAVHIVICGVLTSVPLYSVVSYVFSSALTAIADAFQSGASLSAFLFPVANIVILCCVGSIYRISTAEAKRSSLELLDPVPAPPPIPYPKKKESGHLPIPSLCLAAVVFLCTALLRIPSVGYGWNVALTVPMCAIAAVAAIGIVLLLLLRRRKAKESEGAAR